MFPIYQADHRGKVANTTFEPKGGINLRDYFAAQVIQGILSKGCLIDFKLDADTAYKMADAMIERRGIS